MTSARPNGLDPMHRGIPRLIYLARTLRLCFFPLFTVIAGNLVLLFVPQAREALLSFGEGNVALGIVAFEIAFIAWMISAWYVARLLVGKRFQPDLVGQCSSPAFAAFVANWLPRALAVIAGVPLAVWMIGAFRSPWLGISLCGCSAALFVGLVFRRKVATERNQRWVTNWQRRPHEDFARFDDLAPSAWLFISLLALLSAALLFGLPVGMQHLARPIGAPALLLFALMSWNVFGGFALTYLPKSYHHPAWTWILVLALVLFYLRNENHPVAGPATFPSARPRPAVVAAFREWLRSRPDPTAPVIFIATAGGASRAAYWTTSALGKIEDEARTAGKVFAGNIFTISSVSGGSLGAAAFVTALDQARRFPAQADACTRIRTLGNALTGKDHLSTVVGLMLYPDMFQRFLPFQIDSWDRSRGLEEVWASDWRDIVSACQPPGSDNPNPWQRPFIELHQRSDTWLPTLALNTTAIAAGLPVLQADFHVDRPEVFDLLDGSVQPQFLSLAQAVHNSARFPYISPDGLVRLAATASGEGDKWDRLGDGGYVEASGAMMLANIIRALNDAHLIRDVPRVLNRDSQPAAAVADDGPWVSLSQVRVLVLDNAPSDPSAWLCGSDRAGNTTTVRERLRHNGPGAGSWWSPPVPDVSGPLLGAFSTRGGRGLIAEVDLLELVGGCTESFAELRLPLPPPGEREPSMNWMLDAASRRQMDLDLDAPDSTSGSAALVRDNLSRVQSWLSTAAAH